MPIFVGIHKLPRGAKEKLVKDGWRKYRQSCRKMGLKPLGVVYSLKQRVAYCQTKANSVSQVQRAHKNMLIPLKGIIEVKAL